MSLMQWILVISLISLEIILAFAIIVIPFTDKHARRHGKEITTIRWYLSRPAAHLADFVFIHLYAPKPKYWRFGSLGVFLSRLSTHIKYVPEPSEDGYKHIHYEEL